MRVDVAGGQNLKTKEERRFSALRAIVGFARSYHDSQRRRDARIELSDAGPGMPITMMIDTPFASDSGVIALLRGVDAPCCDARCIDLNQRTHIP